MSPVIRIEDRVMEELKTRAIKLGLVFGTPNDVLIKVLELDAGTKIAIDKAIEPPVTEKLLFEEQRTIDGLLERASPNLREVFLTLRDRILKLGNDVSEKVASKKAGSYCDYRKRSIFAEIYVQTRINRLQIYIKMGDRQIDDPKQWTVKKDFTWGKLNTRFEVNSLDQLDYTMHLIKQAYKYAP
ncbi:MAG: DUF5655 domain-containing protein [Dehalococcoidia bacterium]